MKLLVCFTVFLTLASAAYKQVCLNNLIEWGNADFDWSRYHNLDEIYSWLNSLTQKFPDWIRIMELPTKTYEGRSLLVVKLDIPYCVCDNNQTKKAIFVESNIHAREWISSAVSTFILNELLGSKPGSEMYVLARRFEWYFLVIANPDGFAYSHSGVDESRMWRKTRTPTGNPNCTGADPNRNFPYRWRATVQKNKTGIDRECLPTYSGSGPLSEPCMKAEHDFLCSVGPNLHAFFSFHSYSQVILIPYAHLGVGFDNYNEMKYIGKKAIDAIAKRYGTEYDIYSVYEFMHRNDIEHEISADKKCEKTPEPGKLPGSSAEETAVGSSSDWLKATYRTPIVVTFELRPQKGGPNSYRFRLPEKDIIPTALETLDGILVFLREYEELHPIHIEERECIGYCFVINDWYTFAEIQGGCH